MKKTILASPVFIMILAAVVSALAASAAAEEIILTNPESDESFLRSGPLMNVRFDFNISIGNQSGEFTESMQNTTGASCDLALNQSIHQNILSGYTTDLLIGEYAWSVACSAYDPASNTTVVWNSSTQRFSIVTIPLALDATITPENGPSPLSVTFRASASGGIPQYYYLWDFGNGVFSTQENTTYIYQQNGTYNATITLRDSANQTSTQTFAISVERPRNFTSSIAMDKAEYVVGENAHISINAPLNSTVQLRFYKTGVQVDSMDFIHSMPNSDYIYLLYPPYPVSTAGNYTLNAYITSDGVTNNHTASFRLKTLDTVLPLSANIVLDSTTVEAWDDVMLRSSVSGGIPPYSYEWDVQNDGTIDSTSVDATARYGIGNYTAKLTVRDSNNTQSQKTLTINSKEPIYTVVVTVADSRTNAPLDNAGVTFASSAKTTGTGGSVEYSIKGGNYTLKITRQDYHSYEQALELKEDRIITIKLNSTNPYMPDALSVNLVNPAESSGESFSVKYKATGASPECTLFIKEDGWWASKGKKTGTGEQSFSVDLEPGVYDYRIECSENGTTLTTEQRSIKIGEGIVQTVSANPAGSQESSSDPEVEQLLAWIDESKERFQSLDLKEKEAMEAMDLLGLLEQQRKDVERIARDTADLKYLTGTPTQIEDRRRELAAKLRTIKGEIPKEITVLDSKEFVRYPREDDIRSVLSELKRQNDSDAVDQVLGLQAKVSVLTNVKTVRMMYYYLDPKTFFVVDKKVTKKEDIMNQTFVESIPKEFGKATKDITFKNTYSVLKDTLLDVQIGDSGKVTYYFESNSDISVADGIRSLLLPKNNVAAKRSGLFSATGFSIRKLVPVKISDTTLFLEIVAIVVLVLAYVGYSYSDEIRSFIRAPRRDSHDSEKTGYMRKLIGETMENIERWDIEKAYMNYEEIKLLYKSLGAKDKSIVYDDISRIASEINMRHALKLADEAFDLLRAGEKEKAMARYTTIQSIYDTLPERLKERIHEKSMHLYSAITA